MRYRRNPYAGGGSGNGYVPQAGVVLPVKGMQAILLVSSCPEGSTTSSFLPGRWSVTMYRFPPALLFTLLTLLLLHPANEQDAHNHDHVQADGNPHQQSPELLIGGGREPPDAWRKDIGSVQRRRKCQPCS